MSTRTVEQRLQNVERRVEPVVQILPILATREDLKAAIAPLTTKAELRTAIAPLATKADLRTATAPLATKADLRAAISESEQRMRTHFDVVAESLRDDIRLVAEAVAAILERER